MADTLPPLGPPCRHLKGNLLLTQQPCGIGHPIRKIVEAAAQGRCGTAFMYPCRPGPRRIADCPSYDPKTAEEIAADRIKADAAFTKVKAALPAAWAIKAQMIAAGKTSGIFDCPACGKTDGFSATVALGYNNHMRGHCFACGFGVIE